MGFEDKLHKFEKKWQERWEKEEVFQSDPDDRDKFYITVAYPYPSGGMHLGHVGTYTLPDVFARFQRMKGKNVLFPMAWHVTGTPIIGAVNRLKNREEKQLHVLKNVYNVSEEDLEDMKTPMGYASHFIKQYKNNMKKLGFSVDWRREFTTNDQHYNRFIQWQYRTLREKELLDKGKHPTKFCTEENNPVTTHDLLEGENVEKQEYTLVKFRKDGKYVPMATLRPETVYGVTHTLVNPEGSYVQADVDGETWIVSKEALAKLRYQDHDVEIIEEFKGKKLVGEKLTNPVTGEKVLVLPAKFVDTGSATGVVMSVPAHAPYDWISLKNLKENSGDLEKYGIEPETVERIEPVSIIDVEGFGDIPAKEICEERGIESQEDEKKLEEATEEIYKKEHHTGVLKSNCQEFAGDKISEVKERLEELYTNQGKFRKMWDFLEKVVCRCGGKVVVAQAETWFLKYGDPGWKDKADAALSNVKTIPEGTREDYNHTINWLEDWPCIRNYGLGTKLPFDEQFVVEPLSDSTIYMAFYTIKHLIEDLDPESLTKSFFDYVFKGKGPVKEVSQETEVSVEKLREVRDSFEYWYPLDWRTSANELVQNHLTFFMFHHAALFDRQYWPEGIATWGMGLLEGRKMSSSKGHVILADSAIEDYGADTVRFFMFASCEPWQDFDWRKKEVNDYRNKLKNFYERTTSLYGSGVERDNTRLDKYVLSRLHTIIREAEEALEEFQTRKAAINAFFELNNVLKWYRQRSEDLNKEIVEEVLDAQIRMMAPFIPHICEELWEETGHGGFVSQTSWPEAREELVDPEIEFGEELVKGAIEDTKDIIGLVDEFEEIVLIVAEEWKRKAVKKIKSHFDEHGEIDIGELMDKLSSNENLKRYMQDISGMVQDFKQNPGELPSLILESTEEEEVLESGKKFIGDKFDAEVKVVSEEESDHEKASRAMPGRPAIILE